MIRFFIDKNLEHIKFVELDKDKAKQLRKVLRVSAGEIIELFDNNGDTGKFEIVKLLRESCECRLIEFKKSEEKLLFKAHIIQAILKSNKLDYLVQKCTELGASKITFYQSDRSVVKVNILSSNKLERFRKIAIEAAEQCGRYSIPDIQLSSKKLYDFHELENKYYLDRNCVETAKLIDKSKEFNVFIGPEGGFSEQEHAWLKENAVGIKLTQFTLRSETASIAFLSQISL